MIKEKLLQYKFFQFLLRIKLALKKTLHKSKFFENKYDRKSFLDFQRLIENPDYLYEKEIEFIPDIVKENDIVIDIGANRGEYSFYLSGFVGEKGKVLAFEPGKRAFSILQKVKNRYNLDNLLLFNLALKDRKGQDTLIVPYHNRQSQLLSSDPILGRKEHVTALTLDDVINDQGFEHVDFIKCDTEGSEYLVFSGSKETIRKFRPVIQVEITDLHANRFGHSSDDILELLKELNYQLFYYNYEVKKLVKKDRIDSNADTSVWSKKSEDLSNNNYFFIHHSRISEFENFILEKA
jgi:FkbM family methyltransferase